MGPYGDHNLHKDLTLRYYGIDDEEQEKSLSTFKISFLRNIIQGGRSFFISLKSVIMKKSLETLL